MFTSLRASTYPTLSRPGMSQSPARICGDNPSCSKVITGTRSRMRWIGLSLRTKNTVWYSRTPLRSVSSKGLAPLRWPSATAVPAVAVTQATRPRRR
ncbi:hypothetical protein G6F63_015606 [Rhizopus arrhizus]|nr:hypothetical protein G6F63_015606 [Rhizopus arrhizus]